MPGAARNNDMHMCPKTLPPPTSTPHGPGNIVAAGAAKVFVNGLAAAVEGDTCTCPEPGNSIKKGSSTVFIGGTAAARELDQTTHMAGGMIQKGSTDVIIGG
jgi:uncharacterized Zn-binding protein involved in type VI secretion